MTSDASPVPERSAGPASAQLEASRWLARRDRGLSAAEFTEFARWMERDPEHRAAMEQAEAAWHGLDALGALAVAPGLPADPDLLMGRRRIWPRAARIVLAAAAAIALALGVHDWRARTAPRPNPAPAVMAAQRMDLPDGSVADLNRDSVIDVHFTAGERRVRLIGGEARFTVVKNPLRPFLVTAGSVTVRAVGTVFDVRMQPATVEVLVTEGKVRVAHGAAVPLDGAGAASVAAGERVVMPSGGGDLGAVEGLSHERIEELLAWQDPRLVFSGQRLSEVASLFNRYNRHRLVVADDATAEIRIGGSFRASQVKAFVRLLELSFDVSAEEQPDTIVLRKRK